jgi:hypothetical protein
VSTYGCETWFADIEAEGVRKQGVEGNFRTKRVEVTWD